MSLPRPLPAAPAPLVIVARWPHSLAAGFQPWVRLPGWGASPAGGNTKLGGGGGGRRGESAINPRGAGEGSRRGREGAGTAARGRGARRGGAGVPAAAGGARVPAGGAARPGLSRARVSPRCRRRLLWGAGGRGAPRGSRGGDTPRRAPAVTSPPAEPPPLRREVRRGQRGPGGAGGRELRVRGPAPCGAGRGGEGGRRAARCCGGTGSRPACPPRIVPAPPGAAGQRAGGAGNSVSIGCLRRARVAFTPGRCPLLWHQGALARPPACGRGHQALRSP